MHVIHGGIGRAYDRDGSTTAQLKRPSPVLPQLTVNFRDPTSGQCYRDKAAPCYDWDPSYLTGGLAALQSLVGASSNAGVEVDMLNNKLKTPYSDQFSIGMSNQAGDWLTDATISRVLSYDGFAFTLGNRYPDGVSGRATASRGNNMDGFGVLIVGNNGIETRTTQVFLFAQKPYTKESGWASSIAYTWTSARQNRDINEHYSFDAATIGDYPFIKSIAAPRHRLVVTGSYDGFWGITFGGKLTLSTPVSGNDSLCGTATSGNQPGCASDRRHAGRQRPLPAWRQGVGRRPAGHQGVPAGRRESTKSAASTGH